MDSVIWLMVAFLAVDAVELSGKDNLPKSELPLAGPESVKAFKSLLQKALGSEGTYHRDLLIAAGIIKAPPGYEIPKDAGSGTPKEIPLSPEMQEYFNEHITDILTSLDNLDYALNRLFGERILPSYFAEPNDSWHSKLTEHLKSYRSGNKEAVAETSSSVPKGMHDLPEQDTFGIDCDVEVNSRSAACKDSVPDIPALLSKPAVDFVMTPKSELTSENEFVTSASLVDEIATEYIKVSSEMPELTTTLSSDHEVPLSEQADGVLSFTALDEEFIMHLMSSSFSHSSNKLSFNAGESKAYFEEETKDSTSFLSPSDSVKDSSESEATETELDSIHSSRRVLTFEEVQLLDKSLALKPELKYHVISTFRADLNPISDVYFSPIEETSSDDETSDSKSIGKKRINPRGISLDDPIFYQAPTPGKMLLRYYRDIPDTSFTCENKSIPGFYADQETDCQVFHVCWPGRRESFLCPVGSLFNQRVLSCDKFNNTNCSLSHVYFDVNAAFQEYDDARAHNVTPMPDPMMKPLQNDSGTTAIVTSKADIVELFEADLHFSDMVNKTNITELWDYLPVKAKVFVYPEPADLKTFLAQHLHQNKVRKSKDVRGLGISTEAEDFEAGEPDDILGKRLRIEANILRVLKKLSRKHRNPTATDF